MEKEIGEIKADVKTLIEISKLTRHEQENKNKILFEFMNETNKNLSELKESNKNNHDYIGSLSKDFKEHKFNHFSWLKISGVAIGALAGMAALLDRMKDWGR